MQVWHARDRGKKVESIKLRWRVSYKLRGGKTTEEQQQLTQMGDIQEFSIA